MMQKYKQRVRGWLFQSPFLRRVLKKIDDRRFQKKSIVKKIVDRSVTLIALKTQQSDYQVGKLLAQNGQHRKAISAYQKAIQLDPNTASIYHDLGDSFSRLKSWQEAISAYQKAIEISGNYYWSHNNLGDAWMNRENWSEASQAYQRAVELDPTQPNSYRNLGKALTRLQQFEEAAIAYQKAIELDPNSFEANYDIAAVFNKLERPEQAANAYLRTIDLDPKFYWWYYPEFWKTLDGQNQLDRAVTLYQKAIDKNPNTLEPYMNLGEALTRQGNFDLAVSCYQKANLQKLQKVYEPSVLKSWTLKPAQKPDFIILGTQKGGTSSLYSYIAQHPQVLPSVKKEIEFWSWKFDKGIDWYLSHFPSLPEGENFITGEACPGYLDFKTAPERLHSAFPDVKLIIILRNPVDRAVSHYHHWVRRNQENLSFEEAIDFKLAKIEQTQSLWNKHGNYMCRGAYIEFIKKWMSIFPKEQFLILKSEDFYSNPEKVLTQVFNFLGLPDYKLKEYKKYNSGSYSDIRESTRKRLRDYYQPYNQQLEEYLGRKFDWE